MNFGEGVVMSVCDISRHNVILVANGVLQCLPALQLVVLIPFEIPIELLQPQVPQVRMPEKVIPGVVQKELGIWVLRILLEMCRSSRSARFAGWDERCMGVLDRDCGANHAITQQPVVCHAKTDSPALQEVLHAIPFCFKVIPRLLLARILPGVLPSIVSAMPGVKR